MTIQEWHKDAKSAAGGGEGIPNIFLTELVAHKFIEFVDA